MPIDFHVDGVQFHEKCRLEEAEPLREWLQQNPDCVLDLSGCTHMHTGVLQILLSHGRVPAVLPADAQFAQWLTHYLTLATID